MSGVSITAPVSIAIRTLIILPARTRWAHSCYSIKLSPRRGCSWGERMLGLNPHLPVGVVQLPRLGPCSPLSWCFCFLLILLLLVPDNILTLHTVWSSKCHWRAIVCISFKGSCTVMNISCNSLRLSLSVLILGRVGLWPITFPALFFTSLTLIIGHLLVYAGLEEEKNTYLIVLTTFSNPKSNLPIAYCLSA